MINQQVCGDNFVKQTTITSFNHNRNSQPNIKIYHSSLRKKIISPKSWVSLALNFIGIMHIPFIRHCFIIATVSRSYYSYFIQLYSLFSWLFEDTFFLHWEGCKKTCHENIQTTKHANSFTHTFVKLAKTTTDYNINYAAPRGQRPLKNKFGPGTSKEIF